MSTFTEFVTKTLGADHGSIVKDHSVAHRAALTYGDVGVEMAVVTKRGFFADETACFHDASGT